MLENIELLDGEVFIPIKNTNEVYFISNKGRVYNTHKNGLSKVNDNGAGYLTSSISALKHEGISVNRYLHRLVAEHFIPNPEGKKFVNHIDHDKSNNCVDNLEWVTAKENTAHGIANGKINAVKRGKVKHLSDKERCIAIVMRKMFYGVNEIAKHLGYPRTTLSSVFNNRSNPELVDFMFELCEDVDIKRLEMSLNYNP